MPRLSDIVAFLGCEARGADPGLEVTGVSTLELAKADQIGFFTNPRYLDQAKTSKAGAILVDEKAAAKLAGRPLLVSKNPYRDFARVSAEWFHQVRLPEPGVHPSAVVAETAQIDKSARVGAFVVVEAGAKIGRNASVFPFVYVGADVEVGQDNIIYPHVTLMDQTRLGDRVIIQPGAVLGGDGFGFAPDPPQGYVKVPQRGGVVVEDDVEIQANACIDRGAIGDTVIRKGAKVDNLSQVAHNVEIGEHSVLASQTGISGSTVLGKWVTMAGQSAAGGHLHIGDQAIVTGQAGAGKDVPPGAMVSGSPAQPTTEHHRGLAEMTKLPKLKKKVKELEERIAKLEGNDDPSGK